MTQALSPLETVTAEYSEYQHSRGRLEAVPHLHCKNRIILFNKDLCYVSCTSVPLSILPSHAPHHHIIALSCDPQHTPKHMMIIDKYIIYTGLQLMHVIKVFFKTILLCCTILGTSITCVVCAFTNWHLVLFRQDTRRM